MPAGGGTDGVPGQLRIKMGVHVHEARCDEPILSVDGATGSADISTHRHDRVAVDGHIGPPGLGPGPIDDHPPGDHQIMHAPTVPASPRSMPLDSSNIPTDSSFR